MVKCASVYRYMSTFDDNVPHDDWKWDISWHVHLLILKCFHVCHVKLQFFGLTRSGLRVLLTRLSAENQAVRGRRAEQFWRSFHWDHSIYIYIHKILYCRILIVTPNWLVVWNMNFIFHFIYGMSSFPLTFIFFRGVETTNQYFILCIYI